MSVFDKNIVEKKTITEEVLDTAVKVWLDTHPFNFNSLNPINLDSSEKILSILQNPPVYMAQAVCISLIRTVLDIYRNNGVELKMHYICDRTGEDYSPSHWYQGASYTFWIDRV